MRSNFWTTCLLVLFSVTGANACLADVSTIGRIKPGSIGMAYMIGEDSSSVTLKISFDADFIQPSIPFDSFFDKAKSVGFPKILEDEIYRVTTKDDLLLFDGDGVIARVSAYKISMNFWCESDKGVQYRPTVIITLHRNLLQRIPEASIRYDSFFSFAGVGKEADFRTLSRKFVGEERTQRPMMRDYYRKLISVGKMSDGRVVARLVEEVTDAGCTSSLGEVDEDIRLEYEIEESGCSSEWSCGWKCGRCCGP